jgi:hypothetical protein
MNIRALYSRVDWLRGLFTQGTHSECEPQYDGSMLHFWNLPLKHTVVNYFQDGSMMCCFSRHGHVQTSNSSISDCGLRIDGEHGWTLKTAIASPRLHRCLHQNLTVVEAHPPTAKLRCIFCWLGQYYFMSSLIKNNSNLILENQTAFGPTSIRANYLW